MRVSEQTSGTEEYNDLTNKAVTQQLKISKRLITFTGRNLEQYAPGKCSLKQLEWYTISQK